MLFNSIEYALFLPIVFCIYWLLSKQLKAQNFLLLIASYYFYGSWDVRFLALLAFSTYLDFFTGIKIFEASSTSKKKLWLTLSVCINVGFLAFFKYYNFFAESLHELLQLMGIRVNFTLLQIILPVGISFYTFHGLSYVFDLYRGKIQPTRNLLDYSLFVSFFPLLVAGPIERATHLLPQVQKLRTFDAQKFGDGLKQILWGLIKKIIIADNCAQYSAMVFNHYEHYSGGALFFAAVLFMFEVYGDFGGYSDIALGTARLFGFELLQNFSYPYFSRNISEFWARWHISLSTWFRDYVYIPLGGGYCSKLKKIRNVSIVFLLSGFWHGASYNRILWGGLHALFMIPIVLWPSQHYKEIVAKGKLFPTAKEFFQILFTFLACTLALIVFRTLTLNDAGQYLIKIFQSVFSGRLFNEMHLFWKTAFGWTPSLLLLGFIAIEWTRREKVYALEGIAAKRSIVFRFILYFFLIAILFVFANSSRQFIYFQF